MIEYDYQSADGEVLTLEKSEVLCEDGSIMNPVVRNGKEYNRVFGTSAINIPFQWTTSKTKFDFTKSPSRKKHFF